MSTDAEALDMLTTYAGLGDQGAQALLTAVKQAAEEEVLDTIAGNGPLPTAVMDLRALRLLRISRKAGRLLRPREVEVIFRVAANTAESIDRRMRSTYPQGIDGFLRTMVHDTATVSKAGTDAKPRYEISFDEPAGLEYARQLLAREGLTRDVKVSRSTQTLDLPARMGADKRNPLDVLGLEKP